MSRRHQHTRPSTPRRARVPALVRYTALTLALGLTAACTGTGGQASATEPARTDATLTAPADSSPRPAATGVSPPVAVSPDGRALVDADGHRVPWVADTAWFLTQRLTTPEIERYLDTRVAQGFTVIQMVAVASRDGVFGETADRAGDLPYDGDFGSLRTEDGEDGYWDHVEESVRAAHARGLTVALLPAWSVAHAGETLQPEHARAYGRHLAQRVAGVPVVWVMGGDDTDPHDQVWRELTAGVREVDGSGLLTYHPAGWQSSVGRLDDADITMVQTSHCENVRDGYPSLLEDTLAQAPDAPIVDAEPLYEDHPWCWDTGQGYSTPDQVRAQLWWSLFAGGMGVTYGHHSVWQFHDTTDDREAINAPRPTWQDALEAPAATQVRHLRTFLDDLPDALPAPDPAVLLDGTGDGWDRALVLRAADGGRVDVYLPTPRAISLDPSRLSGDRFTLRWFDPATGRTVDGGTIDADDLGAVEPPPDATAPDGATGDRVLTLVRADG